MDAVGGQVFSVKQVAPIAAGSSQIYASDSLIFKGASRLRHNQASMHIYYITTNYIQNAVTAADTARK